VTPPADVLIHVSFGLVLVLSIAITLVALPWAKRISLQTHIVSRPGGRRKEEAPVAKLGGLALFLGFTVTVVIAQVLPVPRLDPLEPIRLAGLLIGGGIVFFVGVLDDRYDLSYVWQGMGQIVAAFVAVGFQIIIEFFNNPFTGAQTDPWPYAVTVFLTVVWLGLMMNTVNFLDGLDGLAAGVVCIAAAMLFINSAVIVSPPQDSVALLPLALIGTTLAFLIYNFHPASLYMGGGAQYLGFVLGCLSIIGGAKMATILLVMGLPLVDLAWQAAHRLLRGKNPMVGDRGHLHFRLLDSGWISVRQIVLGYYLFSATFGFLALVLDSQLYKFLAFGTMAILASAGLLFVSRLKQSPQSSISS
jgi:UDP-GlcNAc:undecaprenyl-phosphate/decaprenyl-phosphate GlcNAc-1-phosphate transferase